MMLFYFFEGGLLMSDYGLIGKKLSHSYSKIIHEKLAAYTYDLIPLEEDQLDDFFKKKEFKGINVTIPYKKSVIKYLGTIDEHAKAIGAVNTIVNRNGKLYGYNTDYDGFDYMIKHHHICIQNQKILILGNGGAAAAVKAVCNDHKAKKILCVSRHPKEDAISYEDVYSYHRDVDVIINTSPVGMYPNIDAQAIDLNDFPKCTAVIDVVYNPICTKLCLQAREKGLLYTTGLEMLIVQAIRAKEHFLQTTTPQSVIDQILFDLLYEKINLVFIGMPSCGKSTIGKEVAALSHKKFVDLDQEIEKEAQKTIPEIFSSYGEEHFRKLETKITKKISADQNLIIACGGGIIKNEENIQALKLNGILIFLDRDLSQLETNDPTRPLSCSKLAVQTMYQERMPYYLQYSDIQIQNDENCHQVGKQCIQEAQDYIKDSIKKGGNNL